MTPAFRFGLCRLWRELSAIGHRSPRRPEGMSPLAEIGYQLEIGKIARFPPSDPGNEGEEGFADGAKIGGS